MKIALAIGILSFIVALIYQVKDRDIKVAAPKQEAQNKDSEPVKKEGVFSSFRKASNDQRLEERKTFDKDGVLVAQETFLDGMQFGPQRYFTNNKLTQATFIFGDKGEHVAAVRFDKDGVPGYAVCIEDVRVMEEIDRVCGFNGPYQVISDDMAFVTVRENGRVIHEKGYLKNGTIFSERKIIDGKLISFDYYEDGSLHARSFKKELGHYIEKYSRTGKLESKELISDEKGVSYFTQLDENGSEKALWAMTYSEEAEVISCHLYRSVASDPSKPHGCP